MNRVPALRFDVDGTLADTEENHRIAFNRAFSASGLDWVWSVDEYRDLLKVTGGRERLSHYMRAKTLTPPSQVAEWSTRLHALKSNFYHDLLKEAPPALRPGIRRLLTEARMSGVATAIATTTSRSNVEVLLGRVLGSPPERWFDAVVCGEDVSHKKPSPEVYLTALSQLGYAPHEAIALEDSEQGVLAAKAAEVYTVAVMSPWTIYDSFAAADIVLSSLGDPDMPLDSEDQTRYPGAYVTLRGLQSLHGAAFE
jgi:HAD superfamily hydrolase (TIGR01509 family)